MANKILDRGPWGVRTDPASGWVAVFSDDFTHDVLMKITGDFGSYAERVEYAEALVRRLNQGPIR